MSQARAFALRYGGASESPGWALCWTDGDRDVAVPLDCDVEPTGSFSRGDCIGELAPHLPDTVRSQFIALTRGMGYPVTLAEVNATLARLTERD